MTDSKQDPIHLMRVIFGIKEPVDRAIYCKVGFGLMLLKYVGESLLIFSFTNKLFDPFTFLIPSIALRSSYFETAPVWLPWALVFWSLPFLWIAVTMSVRRCVDIGINPVSGVLVLIPIVNLFAMVSFALSASKRRVDDRPVSREEAVNRNESTLFVFASIMGVFAGGGFAVLGTVISANLMHNYGASLFLGMPIVAGAAAGFVYNQPNTKGAGGSLLVGVFSVSLGGLSLLLFALEGVICLAMAMPIIIPFGALGGLLGWFLSTVIVWQSKWMLGGTLLAILPVLGAWENNFRYSEVRMVESSIIVDASREEVWENVVAFPDIKQPVEWLFQLGIATPIRARIDGFGVGAVRHCEFTTGDFVEPITVWDYPNRLAFDVAEQPDPMVELTPYRNIRPPHLSHSFYSVRGEFELLELTKDKTKLVGRTWYVLEMGPERYWKVWTDHIIHRIHMRVLRHIALHAETVPMQ